MKIDEVYVYQIISVPVICFNHSVLWYPSLDWYSYIKKLVTFMWQFEIVGLFPPRRWLVMLSTCHLARRGRYSSFRSWIFCAGQVVMFHSQQMNKIYSKYNKMVKGKNSQNCQVVEAVAFGAWLLQFYNFAFFHCTSDHVRWRCPGCPGPDDCCHGSQRSHGKGWEVAVVDSGGLGLAKACGVGGVGRACLLRKEMDVGQNRRPRGPQMLV